MSLFDFEEEPNWLDNFLTWSREVWRRWTAPDPEKIPYDPTLLRSRLELCLTRIRLVRRKQEAYSKQEMPQLEKLAQQESPLVEPKVHAFLDVLKLMKLLDLLEPHLVLLTSSIDLPTHDMSPMLSVHSIIYAAARVPRIEELVSIRQQLLQKYGMAMAITKLDIIDQELRQALEHNVARVDVLTWLASKAPKARWREDLQEELARDYSHSTGGDEDAYPHNSADNLHEDSIGLSYEGSSAAGYPSGPSQENEKNENDESDDDDDGDDAPGPGNVGERDVLGNSHDSGPFNAPAPLLTANEYDFPEVPTSPVHIHYPSLNLSDSSETPLQRSAAH